MALVITRTEDSVKPSVKVEHGPQNGNGEDGANPRLSELGKHKAKIMTLNNAEWQGVSLAPRYPRLYTIGGSIYFDLYPVRRRLFIHHQAREQLGQT
jgi:hypothetical protein